MREFRFLYCAFILSTFASNALSQNNNKVGDGVWGAYVRGIDAYAFGEDKDKKDKVAKKEAPHSSSSQISPDIAPKRASNVNREMQKKLIAKNRRDRELLFSQIERFDKPAAAEVGSSPTDNSTRVPARYSFNKTYFNWGGKISGYKYLDYEINFESADQEQINQMSASISDLALAGWKVDLNRSFQKIERVGSKATAYTTMQMRFRRRQ